MKKWRSVSYWDSSKQHTKVLPKEEDALRSYVFNYNDCFVSAGFAEDWQPYEAVIKLDKNYQSSKENLDQHTDVLIEDEEYLLEDKYSRAEYDEECLLNEENIELLQQKEIIDELIFGTVIKQGQFLVEEGNEDQSETLICETLAEAVEPYIFQTDNCCVNTGIISVEQELISVEMNETELSKEGSSIESLGNSDHVKDKAENEEHYDKTLAKCKEEIELLEKLLRRKWQ